MVYMNCGDSRPLSNIISWFSSHRLNMAMSSGLALFSILSLGFAIPFYDFLPVGTTYNPSLDVRATDGAAADPSDLSYVKSWAALGDSYAAGIGSGKPLGDIFHRDPWFCSRWDQSYPYLMHQSEELNGKDFKYHACSGWTSTQIREKQVPKLNDKSQQIITLSSGGNDVYLSDLLNACVYQITPGAALSDNCKSTMDKTSEAIDKELFKWLDDLYTALKAKLTDDGKIYVTGYAQFWNSNTDQCDDVTWKMWDFPGVHLVKLTKANRKRMNELAVRVNNKIKEVIEKNHSDKIIFVDIDPYVIILGGRFCEAGIKEPDIDRPGLLFYNRGTVDVENSAEDPWSRTELKRGPDEMPKQSFEGSIAIKFEEALRQHPDWKLVADFSKASVAVPRNNTADELKTADIADTISSLLPDTFKRIFHPRPFLHNLMAQLILWHIKNERAELLGFGRMRQRASPIKPENASCNQKSPHDRPRDLVCKETDWRVPKEKTDDGSTSVMDAIKQFCKNRNGETAEKGTDHEHIYDRWDISGWGVTKRQSLWLRASSGPFSQCPKGQLVEKDCVAVLTGGLNDCDKGSNYTFGYRAQGENCMEYAIETSPSVHEGDPPWAEHVKKYPPPETLMADMYIASKQHQVDCYKARGLTWNWNDANAAIDEYCNNNLKNGGHSKPFLVKKGTLTLSASVDFDLAGGSPYKDKAWCTGFDFNHKNSDDCRYAFRKILGTRMEDHYECSTHYRCVQYSVRTWQDSDRKAILRLLEGIEDNPHFSISGKADVRVAGWNATSGWNSTTPSAWQVGDPRLMELPTSQLSNSSVFVTTL
ncbi:SGNH hydrolase [Cucurbitaria berberidis CBS 394.84]|uniref:SGNH hydrolase n=1 Tax=Cucurbitaria berberidis CBS 394.84 TaxID=1168544 RepID=A0A9P4LCD8_9PLEO|nr:SGNH hydrolase [Cucurbitaria berberidis CBS 394.84]KAF1849905.1 SGNH hydrolase [Cucurbitaria berberidis CBS 394.84]